MSEKLRVIAEQIKKLSYSEIKAMGEGMMSTAANDKSSILSFGRSTKQVAAMEFAEMLHGWSETFLSAQASQAKVVPDALPLTPAQEIK